MTVALTGDAGDELFAGYDRYRAVALAAPARPPAGRRPRLAGRPGRPGAARPRRGPRPGCARSGALLEGIGEPPEARYLRWVDHVRRAGRAGPLFRRLPRRRSPPAGADDPDEADPASVLDARLGRGPERDPVTRAMVADLLTYLPGDLLVKVDLASMAHWPGVPRPVPRPPRRRAGPGDAARAASSGSAAGGRRSSSSRRSPTCCRRPIRDRPKMGFGVPIDRWFRGELKDELRAVLLDPVALGRGLFRPEAVAALVDEHAEGRRDHAYRLWALLMLELWFRHHIDAKAS